MEKKIIFAALFAVLSITGTGLVYAFTSSTPKGFDVVALLIAAGQYKTPSDQQTLVPWFQHTLMGWTDEQVAQQRQMAIDYFNTRFGLSDTSPGFSVFDPLNNYRVYSFTGRNVPSQGWVNRDGSFGISVGNDGSGGQVLHGTFGGTTGIWAPAGSFLVWGYYNVLVTAPGQGGRSIETGETIVVHFESQNPIIPDKYSSGTAFVCHLVAPWGEGLAQGVFQTHISSDGTIQANVRNVWTFPGLGPSTIQN